MYPKLLFCIFLVLFPVAIVVGEEDRGDGPAGPAGPPAAAVSESAGEPEAKMVGGMSVLGNEEAPMSLFIVPWKGSELGAQTSLARTLDERPVPVDREVFAREIAFYEVSAGGKATPVGQGLLDAR